MQCNVEAPCTSTPLQLGMLGQKAAEAGIQASLGSTEKMEDVFPVE